MAANMQITPYQDVASAEYYQTATTSGLPVSTYRDRRIPSYTGGGFRPKKQSHDRRRRCVTTNQRRRYRPYLTARFSPYFFPSILLQCTSSEIANQIVNKTMHSRQTSGITVEHFIEDRQVRKTMRYMMACCLMLKAFGNLETSVVYNPKVSLCLLKFNNLFYRLCTPQIGEKAMPTFQEFSNVVVV